MTKIKTIFSSSLTVEKNQKVETIKKIWRKKTKTCAIPETKYFVIEKGLGTKDELLLNNPNLIAPCGLYCGECKGFQEGKCGGCLSRKGLCLKYTKICQIYSCCVDEKRRRFCSECSDFPCKKFAQFFNTSQWYNEVVGNLERIKEKGVKKVLKEQVTRVEKLIKCVEEKGIKHCNQCKDWPCRNLKRPPLVPE